MADRKYQEEIIECYRRIQQEILEAERRGQLSRIDDLRKAQEAINYQYRNFIYGTGRRDQPEKIDAELRALYEKEETERRAQQEKEWAEMSPKEKEDKLKAQQQKEAELKVQEEEADRRAQQEIIEAYRRAREILEDERRGQPERTGDCSRALGEYADALYRASKYWAERRGQPERIGAELRAILKEKWAEMSPKEKEAAELRAQQEKEEEEDERRVQKYKEEMDREVERLKAVIEAHKKDQEEISTEQLRAIIDANKKDPEELYPPELESLEELIEAYNRRPNEGLMKSLKLRMLDYNINFQKSMSPEREVVVWSIINKHINALRIKRQQKRVYDDYGILGDTKWEEELHYFYDKVLKPEYEKYYYTETIVTLTPIYADVVEIINKEIDALSAKVPASEVDIESLSPVGFESYCAQILRDSGWNASTTKGSSDQGVDIVATKNGIKAIFQCKKLSSPVGNKAVQEATAGKAYYVADIGFVVSNAEFTPAARDLANSTGIKLIHYSQLNDLERHIKK
ncbi:MAG: restriction endonuclease [Desulfomonilia bacterium]|jgi:restriction system protein